MTILDAGAAGLDSDVAARVWEQVERLTEGWPPERKAAVWRKVARAQVTGDHAALAALVQPGSVRTPAIRVIDEHLRDLAAGKFPVLILTMAPQEGKTSTGRSFVAQQILQNPDLRYGIISYGVSLAEETGRQIKGWIEQHGADAPAIGGRDVLGVRLRRDSRAVTRWQLAGHLGGLVSVGLRGTITGRTIDGGLWVDDPVKNPEQVATEEARDKLWEIFESVLETRLGSNAWTLWTLTRWHEDDPAGRAIRLDQALPPEKRRIRVLRIPAQCDQPATDPLGRQLGEYMVSVQNRPDSWWEHKKRSPRIWAAMYQGLPAPAEGGIFKWEWITPYRVAADRCPELTRIAVTVDPTGGGHDEAGIVVQGRAADGRTYLVDDRSGQLTASSQWRRAWFTVLDHDADMLVYEKNLVDPVMRRGIVSAWTRMRAQAQVLAATGHLEPGRSDLLDVAEVLAHGDDDVSSAEQPKEALAAQLEEVLPYAARILAAPEFGPASIHPVSATKGKRLRADPVAQAYEDGRVAHVGSWPQLELQMVTWQEGDDSPDRLDALVHGWVALNSSLPAATSTPAGRGARVPRGPQTMRRPGSTRR